MATIVFRQIYRFSNLLLRQEVHMGHLQKNEVVTPFVAVDLDLVVVEVAIELVQRPLGS